MSLGTFENCTAVVVDKLFGLIVAEQLLTSRATPTKSAHGEFERVDDAKIIDFVISTPRSNWAQRARKESSPTFPTCFRRWPSRSHGWPIVHVLPSGWRKRHSR